MADQRIYTLGADVYKGFIRLEDGSTVSIDYKVEIQEIAAELPDLKDFLEDITVKACLRHGYNYALIRSILHATTLKQGRRVPAPPHVTITAGFFVDNRPTQTVPGHIFTRGLSPIDNPDNWYNNVVIDRVRWKTEQGSSDGSASVSSSNGGGSSSF